MTEENPVAHCGENVIHGVIRLKKLISESKQKQTNYKEFTNICTMYSDSIHCETSLCRSDICHLNRVWVTCLVCFHCKCKQGWKSLFTFLSYVLNSDPNSIYLSQSGINHVSFDLKKSSIEKKHSRQPSICDTHLQNSVDWKLRTQNVNV